MHALLGNKASTQPTLLPHDGCCPATDLAVPCLLHCCPQADHELLNMNSITVVNRQDGLYLERIKCYKLTVLDPGNSELFAYSFATAVASYTILPSNPITGCGTVATASGGITVTSRAGAGTGAAAQTASTSTWDWMLARHRRLLLALSSSNSTAPSGLVQQFGTWLAGRRHPAAASAAARDTARQGDEEAGSASGSGPGFRSHQMYRRRLA